MSDRVYTAAEKLKEAEREVAMRKAVYGKGGRTMSPAQERQLPYKGAQGFFTVPDDILQIGKNLAATPVAQRELFG